MIHSNEHPCTLQFTNGLICTSLSDPCPHGDVKLVEGHSQNEGRVEVCVNGGWGTVTDDGWSTNDGQVICRQLGYSSVGK